VAALHGIPQVNDLLTKKQSMIKKKNDETVFITTHVWNISEWKKDAITGN